MELKISKSFKWLIVLELSIPLVLLTLGIYHGLMQTLYRSGMISQTAFAALDFYQGLTLHGVINALVLTTFFAVAFGHACMYYFLNRKPLTIPAWISGILMIIGTGLASWAMLSGKASVLYTFYPPMKAHPLFYIGASLLVVGSWIAFFGWIVDYNRWRKENKDKKIPLAVLATLINFIIWFVCTIPLAYEVLGMLFPWSMGWIPTINISLARTLFWFFGHALVYFWLLPAYIMFYVFLPKLAGGKLYSDNAGRFAFFLFLLFSIPVGTHHQFSEPAITQGVKFFQSMLTYGVAIPSFITAFTIAASLEFSSYKKGVRGWFRWMFALPFFDKDRYLFAYLICGLIIFIFGGMTGMVNASYSMNSVVHNTAFIPGHFHLTVAGPVFLAIIGASIYILANITGKEVRFKNLVVITPYLWTIGLLFFSGGMMWGGVLGEPRRTNLGLSYLNPDSPMFTPEWVSTTAIAVFGAVMLFTAAGLYFIALFATAVSKKVKEDVLKFPVSEPLHDEPFIGIFNRFLPWIILMLIIILISYGPALMNVFEFTGPGSPPFDPGNPSPLQPIE